MENIDLNQIYLRLQGRKGQWPQICRETELDYSWLSKLARRQIADPGVNKIQTLARHLQLLDQQDAERKVVRKAAA